jgi:NADH:ubiquinone oxidoreductase subunit 6 (subunit J)
VSPNPPRKRPHDSTPEPGDAAAGADPPASELDPVAVADEPAAEEPPVVGETPGADGADGPPGDGGGDGLPGDDGPPAGVPAQAATGAVTRVERARQANWEWTLGLGVLILLLGGMLVYSIVQLWPGVQAGEDTPADSTPIHWLWKHFNPPPETALMLIVILAGALGAFLHVATSFSDYVGNRRLMRSWFWFYVLRPLVGSGLALLFYFAVLGGLFTSSSNTSAINPYGVAALSALVGLFSKQATNKLQQIFDTAFSVPKGAGDDARDDSIANPRPTIAGVTPPQLTRSGDLRVTLSGTGFIPGSVVSVSQPGGAAVPRTAVLDEDAQTLAVTLDPEDVVETQSLVFTVVNPEPGGGTSAPFTVTVVDIEAAEPEGSV